MSICAPGHSEKQGSCYSQTDLETIHNAVFDNRKNLTRTGMLEDLKSKFKSTCANNEACWLDNIKVRKHFSKERLQHLDTKVFKPKGTKGEDDWMSTIEIVDFFNQYNSIQPDFHFINCVPADYYVVYPRKFPSNIFNDYKKSAIVFNTDKMNEPGSHWIAVFFEVIDQENLDIDYFDSTGEEPFDEFYELLKLSVFNKWTIHLYINQKQHQKGNNECGIYAMYYILERMKGRSREIITAQRIRDNDVHKLRKIFFRPYSKLFQ